LHLSWNKNYRRNLISQQRHHELKQKLQKKSNKSTHVLMSDDLILMCMHKKSRNTRHREFKKEQTLKALGRWIDCSGRQAYAHAAAGLLLICLYAVEWSSCPPLCAALLR
jgi:hypothetical protein